MNEILVAVDGSRHSFDVVDVACEIAKGLSAGILLVYSIQENEEEPEGIRAFEKAEQYPDAYADYLQELGDEVTSKLSEAIKNAGIPVRTITPTGNPAQEILTVAEVENPKLIVVGVKGRHGVARFRALGSVARNVVENSKIPVLCVPATITAATSLTAGSTAKT